jgi:hypothetical protein
MRTAFLARPGSPLAERVALRSTSDCTILDGADPRVVVDGESVLWNGTDLGARNALVVEAPWISWPQPIAEAREGETAEALQRRGIAQRERRALHVAALRIAARRMPIANDPALAADLAMSAPLALERLGVARVPVCEWRVVADAPPRAGSVRLALTAEHGPRQAEGPQLLEIDAVPTSTRRQLCIGGSWIAAATGCPDLHSPLRSSPLSSARICSETPEADRELAQRALAALGLVFGCVHVFNGAVAFMDAAVDLAAWDSATNGKVSAALADWLARANETGA